MMCFPLFYVIVLCTNRDYSHCYLRSHSSAVISRWFLLYHLRLQLHNLYGPMHNNKSILILEFRASLAWFDHLFNGARHHAQSNIRRITTRLANFEGVQILIDDFKLILCISAITCHISSPKYELICALANKTSNGSLPYIKLTDIGNIPTSML